MRGFTVRGSSCPTDKKRARRRARQEAIENGQGMRWTPDFGRPDKVEPPGFEAPYQEDDDAGQATCVWGSV